MDFSINNSINYLEVDLLNRHKKLNFVVFDGAAFVWNYNIVAFEHRFPVLLIGDAGISFRLMWSNCAGL